VRTVAEDGLLRASEDVNGEGLDMKNFINRFVREEEGQDLVEYALLIAFIALACIIGLQNLGGAINTTYNSISSSLTGAVS
jgi:pilus assembly protein Flp/PilA